MLVSALVVLQGIAGIPEPLTAKRADVKQAELAGLEEARG
jgi:hypothetical protein